MYGAERYKAYLEEKKKREEESLKRRKERKKATKEKAAKERIRKKRIKYNKRYYSKKRKAQLEEYKMNGDKFGYFMILVVRNGKRVKKLGQAKWMKSAYTIYNDALSDNRENVICEKKICIDDKNVSTVKNEIIIVKRLEEGEDATSMLRNSDGKFTQYVIEDNDNYCVIARDDWKEEELYNVYGYDPVHDRKSAKWILDNLIKNGMSKFNPKRVFVYSNKVFIQSGMDAMDFITCKTKEEAYRLYCSLKKHSGKSKYIAFTDILTKQLTTWILNKMEEKTGWSREKCIRNSTL